MAIGAWGVPYAYGGGMTEALRVRRMAQAAEAFSNLFKPGAAYTQVGRLLKPPPFEPGPGMASLPLMGMQWLVEDSVRRSFAPGGNDPFGSAAGVSTAITDEDRAAMVEAAIRNKTGMSLSDLVTAARKNVGRVDTGWLPTDAIANIVVALAAGLPNADASAASAPGKKNPTKGAAQREIPGAMEFLLQQGLQAKTSPSGNRGGSGTPPPVTTAAPSASSSGSSHGRSRGPAGMMDAFLGLKQQFIDNPDSITDASLSRLDKHFASQQSFAGLMLMTNLANNAYRGSPIDAALAQKVSGYKNIRESLPMLREQIRTGSEAEKEAGAEKLAYMFLSENYPQIEAAVMSRLPDYAGVVYGTDAQMSLYRLTGGRGGYSGNSSYGDQAAGADLLVRASTALANLQEEQTKYTQLYQQQLIPKARGAERDKYIAEYNAGSAERARAIDVIYELIGIPGQSGPGSVSAKRAEEKGNK